MKKIKVGIDPGHGGPDPGAVGPIGLKEKDVVLPVSLELAGLLRAAGIEVVSTRTDDRYVSLEQRADMLNKEKVDLVVSVHVNGVESPNPNYVASFIVYRGGEAEKAAQIIFHEVQKATGWPGPVEKDGVKEKNLHILRETDAPAVLVEMGFITNPTQERQLKDPGFRALLARAIATGIRRHFRLEGGDASEIKGDIIPLKSAPILFDKTIYVPIREIIEAAGGTVNWYGHDRPIEMIINGYKLLIEVGKNQIIRSRV